MILLSTAGADVDDARRLLPSERYELAAKVSEYVRALLLEEGFSATSCISLTKDSAPSPTAVVLRAAL